MHLEELIVRECWMASVGKRGVEIATSGYRIQGLFSMTSYIISRVWTSSPRPAMNGRSYFCMYIRSLCGKDIVPSSRQFLRFAFVTNSPYESLITHNSRANPSTYRDILCDEKERAYPKTMVHVVSMKARSISFLMVSTLTALPIRMKILIDLTTSALNFLQFSLPLM